MEGDEIVPLFLFLLIDETLNTEFSHSLGASDYWLGLYARLMCIKNKVFGGHRK